MKGFEGYTIKSQSSRSLERILQMRCAGSETLPAPLQSLLANEPSHAMSNVFAILGPLKQQELPR